MAQFDEDILLLNESFDSDTTPEWPSSKRSNDWFQRFPVGHQYWGDRPGYLPAHEEVSSRLREYLWRIGDDVVPKPNDSVYLGFDYVCPQTVFTGVHRLQPSEGSPRHEPPDLRDLADLIGGRCIIVLDPFQDESQQLGDFVYHGMPSSARLYSHTSQPWNNSTFAWIEGLGCFGSGTGTSNQLVGIVKQAVDVALGVSTEDDGWEADYADDLINLFQTYGRRVVDEIDSELGNPEKDMEVREETLIQLGSIRHDPSRERRLALLAKYLRADHVRLRLAAGLGLAEINGPLVIKELQHAVINESSPRLQRTLNEIIDKLERQQVCQTT